MRKKTDRYLARDSFDGFLLILSLLCAAVGSLIPGDLAWAFASSRSPTFIVSALAAIPGAGAAIVTSRRARVWPGPALVLTRSAFPFIAFKVSVTPGLGRFLDPRWEQFEVEEINRLDG
jgi:ABC-type Mn2+/Zn2+ transport system permease subunit